MKTFSPTNNELPRFRRYFNSQLIEPLAIAVEPLRNEAEYDRDADPTSAALDTVGRFLGKQ